MYYNASIVFHISYLPRCCHHLDVVDGEKGDDTDNGHNPIHAFKTTRHCVDNLLKPEDSCNIRAGRCHEEVTVLGLSVMGKHPFVIIYIFIQPTKWEFEQELQICSAKVYEDIFALFLYVELLTTASSRSKHNIFPCGSVTAGFAVWSEKSCVSELARSFLFWTWADAESFF